METKLRLVLLAVGLLIIIGVLWDVWRRHRQEKQMRHHLDPVNEPEQDERKARASNFSVEHFEHKIYTMRHAEPAELEDYHYQSNAGPTQPPIDTEVQEFNEESETEEPEISPEEMLSISVVARQNQGFDGSQLIHVLETAQLFFGRMNIFHRTKDKTPEGQTLFSVCNMSEPGYFNYQKMANQQFEGITLFFVINHVHDPDLSLDTMVRIAKQLAFNLNGEMRDQNYKPLTMQTIEQYKAKLKAVTSQVVG